MKIKASFNNLYIDTYSFKCLTTNGASFGSNKYGTNHPGNLFFIYFNYRCYC
jgi:hypothetical protein